MELLARTAIFLNVCPGDCDDNDYAGDDNDRNDDGEDNLVTTMRP